MTVAADEGAAQDSFPKDPNLARVVVPSDEHEHGVPVKGQAEMLDAQLGSM